MFETAISLNFYRRHLTAEQKHEFIAKRIKANPEQSNRSIAKQVKEDHHKVAKVRSELESTGEVSPVEKRIGADGRARKRPAKRKKHNPKSAESNTPEVSGKGIFLALAANAAEKVPIALRNIRGEKFTQAAKDEMMAAVRHLIRAWEGVERKIQVEETKDKETAEFARGRHREWAPLSPKGCSR